MRRRPRPLSPEDRAVWDQVTRTLRPLNAVATAEPPPAVIPEVAPQPKVGPVPDPVARLWRSAAPAPAAKTPPVSLDLVPDPHDLAAAAPLRMDHKAFARMRRGKLDPEARIDLHGMTAGRAHASLQSFILQAHAQGLRLVLVITGKGRSGGGDPHAMSDRKGVLRHAVPQWLAQAPLAPLVLQVHSAHVSHGGTGAYYVYLRRKR